MWITPSGEQKPSAISYTEKISRRPEDYRVLERMPLDRESIPKKFEGTGKPVKSIVILDTETTGLEKSDIIELGIVRCSIDSANCLCSVDEVFDEFNDPGYDIPSEITAMTGITNDMVRGKHIDESSISHILRDDPVIVVYNAEYDRPLFEKLFSNDCHKWVCSMRYYDWYEKGFGTKKLELLLEREGFFFNAHRAYMDCLAVAFMLHRVPESLSEILKPRIKITATNCPYECKDALKERGYRWNGAKWSTTLTNNIDEEMKFLNELYLSGYMATKQEVDQRTAFKTTV